jgi:hypothetical protein
MNHPFWGTPICGTPLRISTDDEWLPWYVPRPVAKIEGMVNSEWLQAGPPENGKSTSTCGEKHMLFLWGKTGFLRLLGGSR